MFYVKSASPADLYNSKVKNGNTRTKGKVCYKFTIKTPEDVTGVL